MSSTPTVQGGTLSPLRHVRTWALGAVLASVLAAHDARGDDAGDPIVVVVAADPAFLEATTDAFVTSRIRGVGALPTPALGELAAESRRLATAHVAVSTIWLSAASSGATLVTYDVAADRFLVRELPYSLPLTATQAAEAARMVRTMLRALRSSNDDSIVTAATPVGVEPPAPRAPIFVASLGAGAWFAAPEAYATPQTWLAIAWNPRGLGVSVSAAFAPAANLDVGMFHGDVRDVVVAADVRMALRAAPSVWVTGGVGIATHVVSFGGAFEGSDRIEHTRLNPAARVAVSTTVELPRAIDVGLAVSADTLLQRQRYEAGAERILLVPRVQLMTGLFVGFRL